MVDGILILTPSATLIAIKIKLASDKLAKPSWFEEKNCTTDILLVCFDTSYVKALAHSYAARMVDCRNFSNVFKFLLLF